MNRRQLFKFLGIGAATAVVAPKVLALMPTREDFYTSLDGKLTVFEKARTGYDYSIGVETGNGFSTPSVFSVMRIGNGDEPCVQVAEYVSRDPDRTQFSYDIAKVAGSYRAFCKDPRGPMLVIEQVTAPGDCTQAQLKIMGFTRFYKAVSAKGIKKDGWYTTKLSRFMLVDRFQHAVKSGWYEPKSRNMGQISQKQCFMAAAQSYLPAQKNID